VITTDTLATDRLVELLDRLVEKSVSGYYNPYRSFSWPDALPEDRLWMSDDLLTVHGTGLAAELDAETLFRLSRWESVNFYSLNVEGIRELLIEVVRRIHRPGFEVPSGFFHHFAGEENEHMWFFAEFCLRYGDRTIYSVPKLPAIAQEDPRIENFLVFARILLFEEIVDFYNMRMAADERLHPTIRHINRIHHEDESRHIAFGRELVALLHDGLRQTLTAEQVRGIEEYVKRYLVFSLRSLYNPHAYRDAGVPDPLGTRARLLADPGRRQVERRVIRKPMSFLLRSGIVSDDSLPVG
jgi:hypothetical protein